MYESTKKHILVLDITNHLSVANAKINIGLVGTFNDDPEGMKELTAIYELVNAALITLDGMRKKYEELSKEENLKEGQTDGN